MNVLTTERLALRHLNADDAEFILELLNDPAFIRNIGDTVGYEGGGGAVRRAGVVPAHVAGITPAGGNAATSVPIVQGIASSYTITPPRTFGIELQYRFF